MKLGVFSLSLFNPESSHPTETHTHFPYNIKCTLSAPPPIPPKFCKTVVLQMYFSLLFRLFQEKLKTIPLQFFLEGSQTRCDENMQFFKVIPSLNENFIIRSFNVINTVAQLQQIINFLTFSED